MFWSKLFGKKKPEPKSKTTLPDLPALNAWGMLFQGNGLSLYSRFAGSLPDGTDYIYLKSYPEVFALERCIFGDWIYPARNGIYLQQWDDDKASACALVYISFESMEAEVLKTSIKSSDWNAGYEEGKPVINFGEFIERFKIE
ncbi:MAG: hypothetical protein V4581_01225 [Bacteroidota bacterium]